MTIALVALSVILAAPVQQDAFARTVGMTMTATAEGGSGTISIMGQTANDVTDVTFKVTSPSGNNIVTVDQITPNDAGEFSTDFKIGPQWTEDGLYRICLLYTSDAADE